MEQVLKMIEGGQVVPGMDKLKSILEEHPDAAWALAIRGRLLLDLREYESLAENADRFIRLQPANPLALTQRAAARVFSGDMPGATEAFLEALNESGREVDSFLMDVALIVAMGLAQSEIILSARLYAMLAASSQGYQNEDAEGFLSQIDSSPQVNHLLKNVPELMERPADADWGERFDEAVSLLRNNKVLLAQDKFESLRRSAAGQPAVLSGLFHCAIWRGDLEKQTEIALLLSQVESMDLELRWRYRAISALLKPVGSIAVDTRTVRIEFENAEQAELALIASDRTQQLSAEQLANLQIPEGEVRPRSAFFVSDRPMDEKSADADPAEAPVSLTLLAVFGKQTDRSAQAIAFDVTEDRVADLQQLLTDTIPDGTVVLDDPQPVPMFFVIDERPIRLTQPTSMAQLTRFNRQFAASHDGKRACQLPLPMLGGKSLAEVADDGSVQFERASVVRAIEGYERIVSLDQALEDVYQISKIDPMPPLEMTSETMSNLSPADFFRIKPDDLDPKMLYILAARSRSAGAMKACNRFASKLVDKTKDAEASDDLDPRMTMEAFMMWMMATPDPEESVKIGDQAIAFAKSRELSFASVLLAKVELTLGMADQEGFRNSIMELEKHYGNDPAVMARVQQLLMQLGIIRPDGSLRAAGGGAAGGGAAASPTEFTPAAPPEQRGGGVWTPDQPNAPDASAGQGGGKLWVPGMD
ncbi:protein-disulfide isomerase [Roseiconus nitratireducens]|uniref:Protein-disulfide isomerase n=1 Tax=Roseiconus nitratireducens TaxID=2605748 RepID=A0A5M6DLU9_9BACT|nr:protein-disulfide isomerase [Roseiconus nitratireducens]KAA5547199.1 protein-disulfide isomerase [Roseiconus nitratireducens]